jgi:hypothetical protein
MTNLELTRRSAQALNLRITESKGRVYLPDGTEWAPLVNGDQCVMLLSRLPMIVTSAWDEKETSVYLSDADFNETHKKNPEAATRRAIVRAAASRVTK